MRLRSAGEANIQIDVTVAVEIAPRCGARVRRIGNPGTACRLDEGAAIVAIQTIRFALLEADEQIQVSIGVVIKRQNTLAACRSCGLVKRIPAPRATQTRETIAAKTAT